MRYRTTKLLKKRSRLAENATTHDGYRVLNVGKDDLSRIIREEKPNRVVNVLSYATF